ncbi:85fc0672-98e5-4fbe-9ee6-0dcaafcfb538 [Sclerotinia trifoliorum]|uniref:Large ribosomal subunit protein uL23m n=1 Tax=Sclerotinia trifoliorum TaxID=28548 RepID=A0A8H2VWY1_9HELO|nr:85fc0672-98e5-4fbe-9ee6-0dcaafcfb538 [Sclerotinia trifoliorum]
MAAPLAAVARAPKMGRKEIFLPNFTITLLRTPNLPPSFASFIVPLNLNKLDMRDYLWNAYGIEVRAVRSYIQAQKLKEGKPGQKIPTPRKWFRPRSIKRMMVEMERPFVWPEEPKDLSPWDKEGLKKRQEQEQELQAEQYPDAKQKPSKERLSIAEQARKILQGKEKWAPTRDTWMNVGEEVEVEQDVKVPRLKRRSDEE